MKGSEGKVWKGRKTEKRQRELMAKMHQEEGRRGYGMKTCIGR